MGINVIWQDESGNEIAQIPDPDMMVSRLVLHTNLSGTTCLKFIDPYGDTIFNQRQIPTLIEELKIISTVIHDGRVESHILRLIELAEQSKGEVHTYLKFLGD